MGECGCYIDVARCSAHREDAILVLSDGHPTEAMVNAATRSIVHAHRIIEDSIRLGGDPGATAWRPETYARAALNAIADAAIPVDEIDGAP